MAQMTFALLVKECFDKVVEEVSNAFLEDRAAKVSEIIRDYKCVAAEEFDGYSVEMIDKEFDRVFNEYKEMAKREAAMYA